MFIIINEENNEQQNEQQNEETDSFICPHIFLMLQNICRITMAIERTESTHGKAESNTCKTNYKYALRR